MTVFPWGDGQSHRRLVLDWSPGLCPYCTDGGVGPGAVQRAPPACWPCSCSARPSNGQPAVRPEGQMASVLEPDGVGTDRESLPCVLTCWSQIFIRPLLPHAQVSVWLLHAARECFLGQLLYGGSQPLM